MTFEENAKKANDDGSMSLYERWRRWRHPRVLREYGFNGVLCERCGYEIKALTSVRLCKYCYKYENRHEINCEKRF